jgi:hypothetical protein
MPTVNFAFQSVDATLTSGVIRVWSPNLRPGGTAAITSEPSWVNLVDGHASMDLEPGPIVGKITGNGRTHDLTFTVPSQDEQVDYLDLLDGDYVYEPEVIQAAQQAAREARQWALRSEQGADRVGSAEVVLDARDQATGAAATATTQADRATTEADRAGSEADRATTQADRSEAEADRATGAAGQAAADVSDLLDEKVAAAEAARSDAEAQAVAASSSATDAGASATVAEGHAQAAQADAVATAADRVQTGEDRTATGEDRTAAAASASTAQGAASTATTEADRATTEADRAQAAADSVDTDVIRREVTDQIAAVVDGAPEDLDTIREVAEYAQENRDITDTLNAAIGQKADKAHTHAVADVTGLQAALDGKAASSHTHTTSQVTGLDTALGAKLDASRIQVVTAMPATPVAGTIYYVTGV